MAHTPFPWVIDGAYILGPKVPPLGGQRIVCTVTGGGPETDDNQKLILSMESLLRDHDEFIGLLQSFFDTLHSLWHQHGCAPGAVDWSWTEASGAMLAESSSLARRLGQRIYDLTGQWPLPCGVCTYMLQRMEVQRRERITGGVRGDGTGHVLGGRD